MAAPRMRRRPLAMALAAALLLAGGLLAPGAARADAVWQSVSDRDLDLLRGGFDIGGGLMVSLGISRAVYINGELVTQTTLNFGRIADLTPVQGAELARQMATLNLVQTGTGNTVQTSAGDTAFGTVIQNTLNNQRIANETVINARTNAMSLLQNLNTQSTLNDALKSVGGR